MVVKRAVLFASLCLSLAMGESVLVRSGYPKPFAARQQGGRPSFQTPKAGQNAKAGDAREVGGVNLRWCPPGRFVMGSPPDKAQAAIGRGAGRGEVDQRLLDGRVRSDPKGSGSG